MTKAVLFPIPFILLLATAMAPAQTSSSYQSSAVNVAVMRQADKIVLQQKLDAANVAVQNKDFVAAAQLYEDAYNLVLDIGGQITIPQETEETISGLVSVRMELAREAQRRGDLHEANQQVLRVLKVAPGNPDAIALKREIDREIQQMRGVRPDLATQQELPAIADQKLDSATLARDGQMLYEAGKLEEAQTKLEQALQLDPDNHGAHYYLSLVKQARYAREDRHQTIDNDDRMVQVERAWELPVNIVTNFSNPYFQTNLVYTSQGREAIYSKLNRIQLDNVQFQSLPLSEVIRYLREQAQMRDPDKQGINFLFNPNIEAIPATAVGANGLGVGPGGGGPPAAINPATGLPEEQPAATAQQADATQINVNNLQLNNVSLAQLLDAICMVADHPVKYSVEDYGVIFSEKGPDSPQYEMRTFKVDPNTFYAGLQNVSSFLFGSVNITSGSGGGGGGGGGGSGGGGGGGSQSSSGAVVPVVNVAPGANSARSSGGGGGRGGGGGGGGGTTGGGGGAGEGGTGPLQNPLGDLSANVQSPNGGLLYVTTPNLTRDVSGLAKQFFSSLGVDLGPPKALFFNDRQGVLFVYATPQDLDIIERAIQVLDEVPPQVHIKARFIDVEQDDSAGLGFDWYLGQFNIGNSVVGQGGNSGSLEVPVSAANSSGTFPGNTLNGTTLAGTVQSLTSGLSGVNSGLPAIASVTGILTDPNFQVVLHAMESRSGTQELAEPEATTISGRQTQMRATVIQPVVTGFNFQQGASTSTVGGGVP